MRRLLRKSRTSASTLRLKMAMSPKAEMLIAAIACPVLAVVVVIEVDHDAHSLRPAGTAVRRAKSTAIADRRRDRRC
jgi:hypothetical protein